MCLGFSKSQDRRKKRKQPDSYKNLDIGARVSRYKYLLEGSNEGEKALYNR